MSGAGAMIKLSQFKAKLKPYRKKIKIGLIVVAIMLFFWNLSLAINNLQTKTTVLGLRFNNKPLSFLDRPQIEQVVKKELELQSQNNLRFSYQGQIIEVKKQDVGAKIDPTLLTNKLINEGRGSHLLQNIGFQTQALLGQKEEKLTGEISQALLTLKILEIQNQVDKDAVPIMPDFTHNISNTLPAKEGVKVDTNKLTVLIVDNIFSPPLQPIPLPTIKTFTTHKEEELVGVKKQALELIKKPISISSGGQVFTLTVDDLKNLLTVVERPDTKDPKKLILVLRLDDKKLAQKLGSFAEKVENITHSEFNNHDSFAAIYAQFYSGKRKLVEIPIGRRLEQKVLGVTNGPKIVYLTFDDGPNSIYHPMILDILKAYSVKATFFLVGQNAKRDSEIAKRTTAEGHKVGNHSLTHTFLPNLGASGISKELQTTGDILKLFNNNQDILFFRPPYGGVNLAVKQTSEKLNLKMFLWDVDPRDWSEPETQELVNRVVNNTFPGADILLHSNHLATVKALPKIIEALKNQGYSFETLN